MNIQAWTSNIHRTSRREHPTSTENLDHSQRQTSGRRQIVKILKPNAFLAPNKPSHTLVVVAQQQYRLLGAFKTIIATRKTATKSVASWQRSAMGQSSLWTFVIKDDCMRRHLRLSRSQYSPSSDKCQKDRHFPNEHYPVNYRTSWTTANRRNYYQTFYDWLTGARIS